MVRSSDAVGDTPGIIGELVWNMTLGVWDTGRWEGWENSILVRLS
jgi:hypothetical protein